MQYTKDPADTVKYQARESPLFALPGRQALQLLFEALDVLEEPVLIVDKSTQICYFNTAYIQAYGEDFRQSHIPIEEIKNWKLTNMADNPAVAPILEVLRTEMPRMKYYSAIGNSMTAFTDIIPLKVEGELVGAVIISRDTAQIAQMSHNMNHYKALAGELRRELDAKQSLPMPFRNVIGSSPAFLRALRTAAQAAPSQAPICLMGESGTGKEVLAEAIHYSSRYADGPLIKVNCAAIPEQLIESELFGYEKGAFTGAKATGNPGKFELANHGTLFLDEIGEMPLSMQVKLLRALQEREITRVGGTKTIQLDFRLVTATNRDLEAMVAEGQFREDLYYRISVIPLSLPPLRQRKGDIQVLANHFLHLYQERYGGQLSFSSEVLELFSSYQWPGNIRELKNCVERMAVLTTEDIITTELLPPPLLHTAVYYGHRSAESYRLQNILDKTERDTIQAVLSLTGGNRSKAIQILGISKRNFYMKLDKYNLR